MNANAAILENPRVTIGGNNPPQTTADLLAERYADDCREFNELIDAAQRAPKQVDDDETQAKIGELVKKIRALKSAMTGNLDVEKAPHQLMLDQVRGFFNFRIDPLEHWRKTLTNVTADYTARKKAAEEKRLAEAAEAKRLEEERLLKLARDAEQAKSNEAAALAEMQRMTKNAEDAKAAAASEQEQAQADLHIAEAGVARVKFDIAQAAADFARRAKDGEPASDEEKAAAKAKLEITLLAARNNVAAASASLSAAREKAKLAKIEQQRAEEAEREQQRAVRAADREVEANLKEAVRVGNQAGKLEAKASSDDAGLGRVRSEHGAVVTSSKKWEASVTNADLLDKEALWPFITEDAKSAALWKWMMVQAPENRVMTGAVMQEISIGTVR